jgi:hypothetical protein
MRRSDSRGRQTHSAKEHGVWQVLVEHGRVTLISVDAVEASQAVTVAMSCDEGRRDPICGVRTLKVAQVRSGAVG